MQGRGCPASVETVGGMRYFEWHSFTLPARMITRGHVPSERTRISRTLRATGRFTVRSVLALLLLLAVVLLLIQTGPGATLIGRLALSIANPWSPASATLESAGGSWLTSLELRGLRIENPAEDLLITIDTLRASYSPPALLAGTLRFDSVELRGPVIRTGSGVSGSWALIEPFLPAADTSPDTTGPGLQIECGRLVISDGSFTVVRRDGTPQLPFDLQRISLSARAIRIGGTIAFGLDSLGAVLPADSLRTGPGVIQIAGSMAESLITISRFLFLTPDSRVSAHGTVDLLSPSPGFLPSGNWTVDANPIAYRDLTPMVSGFGPLGSATVHFSARGKSEESRAECTIALAGGGSLEIQSTARRISSGESLIELIGRSQDLSIAAMTGPADTSERITADVALRGTGLTPEDFSGEITVRARESTFGPFGPFALDLRSSVERGTLKPVLKATYQNLALSLSGSIAPLAEPPAYSGSGTLTITGPADETSANPLRRLAGLVASYRFRGSGFDPSSAALECDLDGRWENHPAARAVKLSGSVRDAAASLGGTLLMHRGSATVEADVRFDSTISYTLDSLRLDAFDLALILGEEARSNLTGTFSGFVTGGDLATLRGSASGRLAQSSLGQIRISAALLDAEAAGGRATIRGTIASSAGSAETERIAVGYMGSLFVDIPALEFRGLDIGAFSDTAGIRSSLSGAISLRARADSPRDLDRVLRGIAPDRTGAVEAEARLTLAESRLGAQPIASASLTAIVADRDLSMDVEVRTPEGGATVDAALRRTVDSTQIRIPSARFRHIDIGALSGSASLRTSLSGSFSLAGVSGPGDRREGTIELELDNSLVNREGIRRATLRASLSRDVIAIDAGAELEHGRLDAAATLLREGDAYTGNLRGDLRLDEAGRLLGLDSSARSHVILGFRSEGTWGEPEQTRLRGLITGKGALNSLRVDSVCCNYSVSGRTLHVDTLFVESSAGGLSGHGALALLDSTQTSDFRLASELTSLDFLKYFLPVERPSIRNARISCSVTGRMPETRVEARADARSVTLDDTYLGELQASGEGTINRELSVEDLAAQASATEMSYGEVTARGATLAAHAAKDRLTLNAYLLMDDDRFARAAGSILTLPDSTVVDIDTLSFAAGGGTWSLEAPARITLGRRFEINRLTLRNGSRMITARGHLDPAGTQDLSLSVDSIALAQLGQFVGRKDMDGFLSLSLSVSGPAEAATAVGTVRADLNGGSSGTVVVTGDIDWRDSTLTARTFVNREGGSPLEARGVFSKPLSIASFFGDGPRDSTSIIAALDSLILRADRFDIATIHPFLNQKSIRRLQGYLSADIAGTRAGRSLDLAGPAAIDSGLVDLPALGVTYQEIALQASLGGDSLRVDRLHVASGGGTVDGDGVLQLGDAESSPGSLHLILDRFLAVQSLNVKATLSGDVRLTGPKDTPTLTGALRLDDSYYYAESGSGEASAEQVELTDADYATLREKFGFVKVNRRAEAPAALPDITADMEVTLERNNWIRRRANPTLAVELDGRLDIAMRPQSPIRIVGTLRPVAGRSYVSQFGRQFEVTSGEIVLTGALEDIELGVDSEYRVKSTSGSGLTEVTLMMRVEGRMGRYAFRLTSDPPMSEPEILQYLATGRASTGALARTNDNYNMGSAAALEQVVGVAGSLTEGKLPFDVFQIRQDGARGVIIVAGNYVSPKTYLGVRQPIILDASSQNTYYKEQTQFEFEYETLPWLFLNFQGGSSRLLLLLKGRYAY